MQSRTQASSGPSPVATATATAEQQLDTQTEAQPEQNEPHAQEKRLASPAGIETPDTPQENGTEVHTTETHAGVEMTPGELNKPAVQPLTEPSDGSTDMETDTGLKPGAITESVPEENTNSECDGSGAKTKDQGIRDGRKYVPSKKAMVDPLKMDMSMVNPLTCEYFTGFFLVFRVTNYHLQSQSISNTCMININLLITVSVTFALLFTIHGIILNDTVFQNIHPCIVLL